MLTQQIFAQRVCNGVDKYAFEVEGCSPLYCWRGVHFEYIHLATLKLRSFASIWNLFFRTMLAQPIFAQRVCMGVDKYAFDVEGCSPLYCWWGVHFEYIHLATLKLRSFASIWNLFFRTMLAQPIFAQRVCMGVDKYAFEVEGCSPLYCWWGVHFENIQIWQLTNWGHLRQFGICFLGLCWLSQFLLKGCAREWTNMHLRLKVVLHSIAGEEYILNIYIWQLSNWGHLRQFGICFLGLCWLSQFLLKGCAWEWTNMHLRLKVVLHCIAGEEYILNIYIWQLSNWGHLRQFGICFLGICWLSQFLLKGCAWEWTNMHLRLKVVLHCIAGEEYILKIYIWQRSNWGHLRQFGISFLKNMLTQQIFAQRVCMGVDKYAFEVEGCSPLYCWWGVHFENIHLATLKLRSFASIWNLFFRNMLAQPIFAQRVCMGVDKYAFEVEGYCRVYCWWGVDFENIHLATLKLRSFASIWNLFFKNMLTQQIFAQRVCNGSRQICIWGWRLFSTVLLERSTFWIYTFGNSQIEVICVNLESVF